MLYPVMLLGTLGVVETFQRANQITGYTTNTLKFNSVFTILATAFRTHFANNTVISANRIPIHRMID